MVQPLYVCADPAKWINPDIVSTVNDICQS
jgi:hypothetical protein